METGVALDRSVRAEIYRFFVSAGRAPTAADLCEAVGQDQAAIEGSLQRMHEEHLLVLAPGTPYIWMANPFSALPTPFSVAVDGRGWFGNCIWDALGIIALLGGSGSVTTSCPDCREELKVTVQDGRLISGEGVVHFAIPARHWWDDIGFN